MDTTFITIHDLSEGAHILYSSDSIVDILGHTPDEVVNRSAWDFFHDEDKPLAQQFHLRGVKLDKAAVLAYCRIKNRQGEWIGCECCFSIVYDVMVCCISIYRHGMSSQKRALEAPIVRRLFASSPKDPRYHMLSHLSSKFTLGPQEQTHEPRAALFLNRFTRTLTVMYATSGIEQIIGIPSEAMKGRSFYSYIEEDCLRDAVQCLESAKGNDSIAYMRFYLNDAAHNDPPADSTDDSEDDVMTDITNSEDESEVGTEHGTSGGDSSYTQSNPSAKSDSNGAGVPPQTDSGNNSHSATAAAAAARSSPSSPSSSHSFPSGSPPSERGRIELEAVVSCTSDGLVVCLRRARPAIPTPMAVAQPSYPIFAAPWAPQPVFHPALPQNPPYPLGARHPDMMQYRPTTESSFMKSIRDVAVFAWALTGINGSLAEYGRGQPVGESQPPDGFPIWDPTPGEKPSAPPSGYVSGTSSSSSNHRYDPFGDPGLN